MFIYDKDDLKQIQHKIEYLQNKNIDNVFIRESLDTIKFLYEDLIKQYQQLKCYEDYNKINKMKISIEENINKIKKGHHLLNKGNVVRLAYLSELDHTLQPYSLYIPYKMDDKNNPKLLIYLHGSGADDTSLNRNIYLLEFAEENNIIIVAPNGRGTSHFYCPYESMKDVEDITKKIKWLFHIKDKEVLLSGFSMGGYGVYRIYDNYPDLYKGLIIFSGHHHLIGEDYSKKIDRFKNIPMIIFHGKEDRNCSYNEVKAFFEKVRKINKDCKIYVKDDIGHSGLIKEWVSPLNQWLYKNFCNKYKHDYSFSFSFS